MSNRFFEEIVTERHPIQSNFDALPVMNPGLAASTGLLGSDIVKLANKFSFTHRGNRTFTMSVPNNETYSSSVVITLPPSSPGAVARLGTKPKAGDKGQIKVTVEYSIPPGGLI